MSLTFATGPLVWVRQSINHNSCSPSKCLAYKITKRNYLSQRPTRGASDPGDCFLNAFPYSLQCKIGEFAEPEEHSLLRENIPAETLQDILKDTVLKRTTLNCVYSAARDGFDNEVFFDRNRLGFGGTPSLVIGQTEDLRIFGGFNPVGFDGRDDYRDSANAFLFAIDEVTGNVLRSRPLADGKSAIFDFENTAVKFGAASLVIPMNRGKFGLMENEAFSQLGIHYEELPNGMKSIFGVEGTARLKNIEVWIEQSYISQALRNANSGPSKDKGPLNWLGSFLRNN